MEWSVDREWFWQEQQILAWCHQQIIQQERLVRRMGLPLVPKRTWKGEMQLVWAEIKQHLRNAALQLGRELLKAVGLR